MLIDFLHGKVFDTLSDLVRSCRLPWRRAEDLIVISSHGGPLRLVAKAKNSYHSPTPIIETEGMITSTGSPPQLGEKIIDAPHTPADTARHLNRYSRSRGSLRQCQRPRNLHTTGHKLFPAGVS